MQERNCATDVMTPATFRSVTEAENPARHTHGIRIDQYVGQVEGERPDGRRDIVTDPRQGHQFSAPSRYVAVVRVAERVREFT